MAIEKVKAYFESVGLDDRIMEFDTSSATVELAAKAAGCEPARIGKTLSFLVDEKPILIVVAGDARIANPKFKAHFSTKPKMISADEAEGYIGHAVGGVCPFAINEGVDVYLDKSLKRFDFVYPAAGNASSAVKLSIPELEEHSHFIEWVDVCKDWE